MIFVGIRKINGKILKIFKMKGGWSTILEILTALFLRLIEQTMFCLLAYLAVSSQNCSFVFFNCLEIQVNCIYVI